MTHIFFHRLLDGWAIGGLLANILIVWILLAKERSSPRSGRNSRRDSSSPPLA